MQVQYDNYFEEDIADDYHSRFEGFFLADPTFFRSFFLAEEGCIGTYAYWKYSESLRL